MSEWSITGTGIGDYFIKPIMARVPRLEDAHLIASAVNACIKLNPDNPIAVAESISELYEALKEAVKWIRYDRKELGIKGRGDYLLTKCNKALSKAEGVE